VTDDEIIERWDAGIPAATPAEAEARRPYERLAALIRDLEDIPPLPGWEERAMEAFRSRRRGRCMRRIAIASLAVAALIAALSVGAFLFFDLV